MTKRAMRILDRIAVASNTHHVKPAVLVGKTPGIGTFDHARKLITLDSGLYAIANKFGDRADNMLAFIIGHEYAHYVRGHDFDDHFQHSFGSFATVRRVNNADGQLLLGKQAESEADYYGLFYALMAGYDVSVDDCQNMWSGMHEFYGISGDSASVANDAHPATDERLSIAAGVLREMRQLVHLHEIANVSLMTGQYFQAAVLYEYICKNVNIPSVNWNELLARYLHLQSLAKIELANPKVLRMQFVPEFKYRSSDQFVKLDIEQVLFRCKSLIDVIRASGFNASGVNHMQRLVELFDLARECANCQAGAACNDHRAQGQAIENDLVEAMPRTGAQTSKVEDLPNPHDMLDMSMAIEAQTSTTNTVYIAVSLGAARLITFDRNGSTLLRYVYRAPKTRTESRIDMEIKQCSTCSPTGIAHRDNMMQQSFDGKLVRAATFVD
jgi:hypothetical protein